MASPPAVVTVGRRGAVVAVVVEVEVEVVVLVVVVAVVVLVVVTAAVITQVGAVVAELSQSCSRGWFVGEVESKLSRCRYSISEEIDRRRRLRTVSDWANRTRCRVL